MLASLLTVVIAISFLGFALSLLWSMCSFHHVEVLLGRTLQKTNALRRPKSDLQQSFHSSVYVA